jgi:hypothetical protein
MASGRQESCQELPQRQTQKKDETRIQACKVPPKLYPGQEPSAGEQIACHPKENLYSDMTT